MCKICGKEENEMYHEKYNTPDYIKEFVKACIDYTGRRPCKKVCKNFTVNYSRTANYNEDEFILQRLWKTYHIEVLTKEDKRASKAFKEKHLYNKPSGQKLFATEYRGVSYELSRDMETKRYYYIIYSEDYTNKKRTVVDSFKEAVDTREKVIKKLNLKQQYDSWQGESYKRIKTTKNRRRFEKENNPMWRIQTYKRKDGGTSYVVERRIEIGKTKSKVFRTLKKAKEWRDEEY